MKAIVQSRQSLLDIAVQYCGSLEAVFTLAQRNNLSVVDDLTPGQQIEYLSEDILNRRMVEALESRSARPATAISQADANLVPYGGIGYMGIGIDFIIS